MLNVLNVNKNKYTCLVKVQVPKEFKTLMKKFDLDLIWTTPMLLSEGKCYSITEMKDILEEIGFQDIKHTPTVLNRGIITGKKI